MTVTPGGSPRDTSRYPANWQGAVPVPTLQVAVLGEVVLFTGQGGPGQVAGLRVDGQEYAYRLRDGDTPGLVAAVLAAQVRVDRPALLQGTSVLLLDGRGIVARVVADGAGGTELRRQVQPMRLTLWCPAPDVRDRLAAAVDLALAWTVFLDVGGWGCRMRAAGGSVTDDGAAPACGGGTCWWPWSTRPWPTPRCPRCCGARRRWRSLRLGLRLGVQDWAAIPRRRGSSASWRSRTG